MTVLGFILWLVVGAVAGWIAGELMRGHGFGLVGNIVVGIIGAVIGGFLFTALGVGVNLGIIGSLITATLGAIVLLFIIGLFRRTTI